MNLKQLKNLLNSRIEEVFDRLNIEYEILGDNIYSTCPVHESSDNPRAFSFSKDRGIWKCWTRECQNEYRNDILGLIHGILSKNGPIEFGKALAWIHKEFGIVTTTIEPKLEVVEDELSDIIKHIHDDIRFPECSALNLKINLNVPSKYFINRGFKAETLMHFGVGDCTDKTSKLYDRSVIPIHDDTGENIIAYIGRSTKEYKLPKFLIYPKGFDKRFSFYNMHRALPFIKKSNTVFIVEGQGDVWKLYESGIYNAIGIFGRTLTKEQQKKLQTLPITHLVVLTDNDQAGRESKIQLQRQLGRFYKLSFPKLQHKDIGDMTIKQIHSNLLSQIRG
jgi:5S rRNA maturation endonuclease (ribonuclease M5)